MRPILKKRPLPIQTQSEEVFQEPAKKQSVNEPEQPTRRLSKELKVKAQSTVPLFNPEEKKAEATANMGFMSLSAIDKQVPMLGKIQHFNSFSLPNFQPPVMTPAMSHHPVFPLNFVNQNIPHTPNVKSSHHFLKPITNLMPPESTPMSMISQISMGSAYENQKNIKRANSYDEFCFGILDNDDLS